MSRIFRGLFIIWTMLRFGLDELVLSAFDKPWIRLLTRMVSMGRNLSAPRGERLRLALERLGPIFVKFGQVMSTRRDLLPPDIADELARLQDRVPPFDSGIAVAIIERAFGRPLAQIFATFEHTPTASASIAQVHFATLPNGREVAVKVLRPNMLPAIEKDLALLRMMAGWVEGASADGKRLKPREVVGEFDKYLHDELDLLRKLRLQGPVGFQLVHPSHSSARRMTRGFAYSFAVTFLYYYALGYGVNRLLGRTVVGTAPAIRPTGARPERHWVRAGSTALVALVALGYLGWRLR